MLAPSSENELIQRARDLAGRRIGELARQQHIPVPADLKRTKGWVGELLEICLGATANTLPEPDFQALGIELKTIPLKADGLPKESTFVCTAPLTNTVGLRWRHSTVYKKLKRVLWLPIEADATVKLAERRIGNAVLWSPDAAQEAALCSDWQEIIERISLGQLETISSALGQYLQLRPKAANARSLAAGIDSRGNSIQTLPRGFYLRSRFTRLILQQQYHPCS